MDIEQAVNFTKAMVSWASHGFPMVSEQVLSDRKAVCKNCEYWDGTGIVWCKKCGCSGAKLHLSTSKCPIGLWSATKE